MSMGCTQPPRPHETVLVKYQDPAGNPVYRKVVTDEFGCYEDFYAVVEGGAWEVEAFYPGDDCSGPATSPLDGILVPLPTTGDQDGDGVQDDDEVQGDTDGDGIPNPLDQDSDNDGLLDGDESHNPDAGADAPPGQNPNDPDNDRLDNIVDPDSDNDGILDGDDPAPYDPAPGSEAGQCPDSPFGDTLSRWLAFLFLVAALLLALIAYLKESKLLAILAAILVALVGFFILLCCLTAYAAFGWSLLLVAMLLLLWSWML